MSSSRDEPRLTSVTGVDERPPDAGGADRLCLVVIGTGGSGLIATHPLPENGEASIGRAPRSDVHINDPSVSRRHAILRIGPPLSLEDCGSANGTRVRGGLLPAGVPTAIGTDEVVELGSVLMIAQRRPIATRPLRLWSHDYFEGRLDEEHRRAEKTGNVFALLRLHAPPAVTVGVMQNVFAEGLRAFDVAGIYGPGEYEVLLCETSAEVAMEVAAQLQHLLSTVDGIAVAASGVGVGIACYPRDGRSPEALMARAGDLARGREPTTQAAAGSILVTQGTMQQLRRLVERIAAGTISVLVLGETGVGKEVLAETVHKLSPRAARPFLRLNCAALSESLLESELFGHERGAFTGAVVTKLGLLETAEGGTVFLDEVGELPMSIQVKLLRVIEARQVMRVGSVRSKPIDVRFVAATNRDLEAEVARGGFRQDLFFRLNGVALVIPPLRERIGEIDDLARAFIRQATRGDAHAVEPRLAAEALALLRQYSWPGNIRELRNVIERAVLLCAGGVITLEHLPVEKMRATVAPARASANANSNSNANAPLAQLLGGNRLARHAPSSVAHDPSATLRMPTFSPFSTALPVEENPDAMFRRPVDGAPPPTNIREELSAIERIHILEALNRCAGNQTQAAKQLGMSRRTLLNRLEKFGIARPRKR